MRTALGADRTPDGYRLVLSRAIDAPAATIWDAFVDPEQWPAWGPTVTAVECGVDRIERGTTGRVRTVFGVWVPFEVTTCADRRWSWRIGPVQATGHRVREAADGRCVASFEIPPLGAPYTPVCWLALRRLEAVTGEG